MSGPWDRPSSDDLDAEWPSEDLGRSGPSDAARVPRDATSPSEPPGGSGTDGAPGWDDWPPAPPPPDDYLIEEPLPPSSDPWAESWTEEDADAMLRAASESPPASAPAPEPARWEPAPPADPPWPEPEPEVDRWEPAAATPLEPEIQPAEPEPESGPQIQPWSPDVDPWHADQIAEPRSGSEAEAPPVGPESEPEPAPEPEPHRAPVPRWPSPSADPPDWLAEPYAAPTSPPPSAEAVEPSDAELEAPPKPETELPEEESQPRWSAVEAEDATLDPWVIGEPGVEPSPVSEEGAEPESAAVAEPRSAADEPEIAPEKPSRSWRSALPWFSPEPDPAPAADVAATDATPEAEPRGEAEPEPEPMEADSEPVPRSDDEPEAAREPEPDVEAEPEPPMVPIAGGLTIDEPEDVTPSWEVEPEPPDPWAEPAWPERADSTRVMPASWTPPAPAEPEATGELDPTAGPIRTILRQPDADASLDEDELADASTAEQAVPWLIGVILLLAGMVIVLLALIFAGDASLGGSAPTPSPTLAVVVPGGESTPTPQPSPSPTAAPVASIEATPSPIPLPQYGPLEMIYQGRAAALAPIYLLRRDFTVEQEPAVMAQDGTLDVRRFAWAPDGRAGAGLLADVLVSIEPGTEKRRLGDGLDTITFGDDISTVYAVRVTADGADDVVTVLAIDFVSGDTEELASVSYARPAIEEEAALSEAQFSDEGGTIRLFWMNDDTLRLWSLGAGAWAIDPADGTTTELEGAPLPTLWSPDGRRHIGVEAEGDVTTLTLLNTTDRPVASTTVEGLVSHLRWSPRGDRVVFTVGRSAAGGGVVQNLFLWDLADAEAPMQLTNTGAAFGAEWLGTQPLWKD